MSDDDLLAEQQAFYGARAPEYDDWWQRTGRYDRGAAAAAQWQREVEVVDAALDAFGATGDVLELAGGTGWWTRRLARTAGRLTVVDGSPETLAFNREAVDRADVDYVVADLFGWEPPRTFEVVFFSFWLSHVPRERFGEFWRLVRRCGGTDGRVFLIDNVNDSTTDTGFTDPYVVRYSSDLHLRRLSDGSEYRVVKVLYEPDELQRLLLAEGWQADLAATHQFLFGSAQPVTPP